MNAELPLGELLREALSQRMEARTKFLDAQDSMIRAGYSREEVIQFTVLRNSFEDLSGSLACMRTLVRLRRHVPSACNMEHLAAYMIDAVRWMYGVLARSHVDPQVFGLKSSETEFIQLMEQAREEARALLNEGSVTAAD